MTALLTGDTLRYVFEMVPGQYRLACAGINCHWYSLIMTIEYKHWCKRYWWDQRIGTWLRLHSKTQRGFEPLKPPYSKAELQKKEARMHFGIPHELRSYLKYVSREFAIGEKWFTVHLNQLTSRDPSRWRLLSRKGGTRIELQMGKGLFQIDYTSMAWRTIRLWLGGLYVYGLADYTSMAWRTIHHMQPATFLRFLTPPENSCLCLRRYPCNARVDILRTYYCVRFGVFQKDGLVAQPHDNQVCLGLV